MEKIGIEITLNVNGWIELCFIDIFYMFIGNVKWLIWILCIYDVVPSSELQSL